MGLNIYFTSIKFYKSFSYRRDKDGNLTIISAPYYPGKHNPIAGFRPVLDDLKDFRKFLLNEDNIICPELPASPYFQEMIGQGYRYQGENYFGDF